MDPAALHTVTTTSWPLERPSSGLETGDADSALDMPPHSPDPVGREGERGPAGLQVQKGGRGCSNNSERCTSSQASGQGREAWSPLGLRVLPTPHGRGGHQGAGRVPEGWVRTRQGELGGSSGRKPPAAAQPTEGWAQTALPHGRGAPPAQPRTPCPPRTPHLPRRVPRGGGPCASSPSSSSAAASWPSWTPRGSFRRTPGGGQSVGCTGRGLQKTRTSARPWGDVPLCSPAWASLTPSATQAPGGPFSLTGAPRTTTSGAAEDTAASGRDTRALLCKVGQACVCTAQAPAEAHTPAGCFVGILRITSEAEQIFTHLFSAFTLVEQQLRPSASLSGCVCAPLK